MLYVCFQLDAAILYVALRLDDTFLSVIIPDC